MAPGGTGSYLANAANRRKGLNRVRQALLDRPGVARQGGPPPPTAPAQERTSPQQQALGKSRAQQQPTQQRPQARAQAAPQQERQRPALNLDAETRQQFLGQIQSFLMQVRREKRARLHTRLGRSRRFFGGGI